MRTAVRLAGSIDQLVLGYYALVTIVRHALWHYRKWFWDFISVVAIDRSTLTDQSPLVFLVRLKLITSLSTDRWESVCAQLWRDRC
jgi:hypothetical protein